MKESESVILLFIKNLSSNCFFSIHSRYTSTQKEPARWFQSEFNLTRLLFLAPKTTTYTTS